MTADEFAAQFRASFRTLWLIAAGVVGNRSLADDVVQEAALVALEKLEQFRPGTNFTAWMGQMVRFVALNYGRKERKRPTLTLEAAPAEPAATAAPPPTGSSVTTLARGELPENQRYFDDRVLAALRGISDTARACLLLRIVEDMSYSEIATVLDIPEGTAMSHVHRARQALHAHLIQHADELPIRQRVPT